MKKPNGEKKYFLENLYTGRDNPFSEGIRSGDWKYIRMYDGVEPFSESDVDFTNRKPDFEQLFNLKDDPEENNNLVGEFEGTKLLDDLRKNCQNHSVKLNKKRSDYCKKHEIVKR